MERSSLQQSEIPKSSKDELNQSINDPVSRLHELFGRVACSFTLIAGVHNKCCFKVTMTVKGNCFSATGTTLKLAKRSCALLVLSKLEHTLKDKEKNFNAHVLECNGPQLFHKKEFSFTPGSSTKTIAPSSAEKENKEKRSLNVTAKQNVLTLPTYIFNNANTSKVQNSKVTSAMEISHRETYDGVNTKPELGHTQNNRMKSPLMPTSEYSNIDLINAYSGETKACIRRFTRNEIVIENSTSYMNEETHTEEVFSREKQVIQAKTTYKRPAEENSGSVESPMSMRCATTKNKTMTHFQMKRFGDKYHNLKKLRSKQKFKLEGKVGSSLVPFYLMSTKLSNRRFFGHGKTIKLAERDATLQALNYLKNNQIENSFKSDKIEPPNCSTQAASCSHPKNFEMPAHISNLMEAKMMCKFNHLTFESQEVRDYKVLAGIIMTIDMDFEQAEVVSIATGTKCVNGGNICCNGSVLNDSHAEILAKRGLMKFLYAQLRRHCMLDANNNSIFQRNPSDVETPYILKPNVHFHLYISTAPCGDARVFSLSYQHQNYMTQSSFNKLQYGQLRTKIEGEMGTTPVGVRLSPQTWDGVLLGEPLHTMSCSDKIVCWNVVGIQGALLSHFVNPIYLHSIILGGMFNKQHLYRAVCGRIQHTLDYLPETYRLNRPLLANSSTPTQRSTFRPPGIGINWTLGDSNIEIISMASGRRINNIPSSLSKKSFFFNFIYLCNNLPNIGRICVTDNYAEAKANAKSYQDAKREVFAAFYRAELGAWLKKPIEQNEFNI